MECVCGVMLDQIRVLNYNTEF